MALLTSETDSEDPEIWGVCPNSRRSDIRCPHRNTRSQHLCIGRDCPQKEEQ